jgi:hypothetical protein
MLYSSRLGGKLCLLIGVRTLPLLRSIHNKPPFIGPPDLHTFWFMIKPFREGGWGAFPK